MDRRAFLRTSCLGCAGMLALGTLPLQGCSTLPIVKGTPEEGVLRIPRSSFDKGPLVMARDPRLPFDLLVEQGPDNAYRALYMRCTHRDQPLTATTSGLYCPAHGSRFGLDGAVQVGPADRPLTTLPVAVAGDDLLITLKNTSR
ncbi:MAG: Rieske (2Fe-2S) protein [Flavobacteriales bacterium]